MDEHLFARSLFILHVLLARNHRMLLLMLVGGFNMLRRIQHANGMLWQYFFRVQNESLQLSHTTWVQPRPQHYFKKFLASNQLDFQWKLHFRADRETFEFICLLVAPGIQVKEKILISGKQSLLQNELLLHFANYVPVKVIEVLASALA